MILLLLLRLVCSSSLRVTTVWLFIDNGHFGRSVRLMVQFERICDKFHSWSAVGKGRCCGASSGGFAHCGPGKASSRERLRGHGGSSLVVCACRRRRSPRVVDVVDGCESLVDFIEDDVGEADVGTIDIAAGISIEEIFHLEGGREAHGIAG